MDTSDCLWEFRTLQQRHGLFQLQRQIAAGSHCPSLRMISLAGHWETNQMLKPSKGTTKLKNGDKNQ